MKERWLKEDLIIFKKIYSNCLDRVLAKRFNRSLKSIDYIARKLKLKKDQEFFSQSRKKLSFNITKETLENMYYHRGMSIRRIAIALKIGKTTVEYYLKKFNFVPRKASESLKIYYSNNTNWIKGKNKKNDQKVRVLAENVSIALHERRKQRLKSVEIKFSKSIESLLRDLYITDGKSLDKISEIIGFSREIVTELINFYKIPLRPRYAYISLLKGTKHSMYGKNWEKLYGKEGAEKMRKERASMFRSITIKRLKNNEFPFFDTKIEILMANELLKRQIPFVKQFIFEKKFVCDFAIPNANLIIECDGDYWHANPKTYNYSRLTFTQNKNLKRDKIKDKFLSDRGWKILRFYESDIIKDVRRCADVIENELKKVGSPLDKIISRE